MAEKPKKILPTTFVSTPSECEQRAIGALDEHRKDAAVAELPFPSKSEQPDGDEVAGGLFAGSG